MQQRPGPSRRYVVRAHGPRPVPLLVVAVLAVLTLAGCTGADPSGDPGADPSSSAPRPAGQPTIGSTDLLRALDVCSLVTSEQVAAASGQPGEPTSRLLGTVEGYPGLTDQCGFGVSFDSFTVTVDVGLEPAGPGVIARLPVRPVRGVDVAGIGRLARAGQDATSSSVSFVKGRTFVRVQAVRPAEGGSRLRQVAAVARAVSEKVPSVPPASDEQTDGDCRGLDAGAVAAVLGAPAELSRSLVFKDRSIECSFATGVGAKDQRVIVSRYTNVRFGEFIAGQKDFEAHAVVPGVPGDAFTLPGTAYAVADDGQVVAVTGRFGPETGPKKPLTPTSALGDLLSNAVGLLQ